MKKYLIFVSYIMFWIPAGAQDVEPLNENGEYERKELVTVDGVSAADLYLRAIESLNDWEKSSGKSNSRIEVSDKESALVVFKGRMWEGSKTAPFGVIWDAYSDFLARIKCKDGRAQIAITVSSMTFIDNQNHKEHTAPLRELIPYKHKTQYTYKKTALQYVPQVYDSMGKLIDLISRKLISPADDDF